MSRRPRHHRWVRGQLADQANLSGLPSPLLPPVSAHRRRRGPYTAAGTIMRALVPDAVARFPHVAAGHAAGVLTAAPELHTVLDPGQAIRSVTSADHQDATRFVSLQLFPPQRTLRLAHDLTEFLRDYALAARKGPASLIIGDVAQADDTDQEFFAVLLRRLDPGLITLVLVTGPAAALAAPLADALERFAEAMETPPGGDGRLGNERMCAASLPAARLAELAAAYVDSDCLAVDAAALASYQATPDSLRRQLHDHRAAELARAGEYSLRLGAIAYHRERGGDQALAIAALRESLQHCIDRGFFPAAADLGRRGLALASWQAEPDARYWFATKLATALIALARADEAELLYEEIRQNSADPAMHMSVAYATAILLTRHYSGGRRDHRRAFGWLNEAAAITALLPDSPQVARQRVLNKAGRALVENHSGNGHAALRLVADGLELLASQANPTEVRLLRSVLHHRNVQTYARLDRPEMAVAEYRKVLDADPDNPEHRLELGTLLHELGRSDEALAEFEAAIALSPPFAEAYYNRAGIRAEQDDQEGAAADYAYVIELAPDTVDAYINLASALDDLGDAQAAAEIVDKGLAVEPGNAYLLTIRGELDLAAARFGSARMVLGKAIASDPELASAWAACGMLAFQTGELDDALASLSRAWELSRDTGVLFNRAVVHQALGNWAEAITDLGAVLEQDPEEEECKLRIAQCRAHLTDRVAPGITPL